MNRDVLIGVVAGMAALSVMGWRRTEVSSPDGVYQATIDQKKYREMEQTLAPPSLSTLETRRRLQTRIEKLEVQNARFDWIIGYLADASGVDIAVEWAGVRPYAPPDQPVSLNLYNVPVIQALQEALAQAAGAGQMNVALRIEPGRVLISLADRLNKREQVMRVYDVRDLLHMALDPSWALKPWKGPPAPLP